MIIKIIKRKKLILKLFKVIEYNKTVIDEISEDKEEYFEIYNIIIQLIIKTKAR